MKLEIGATISHDKILSEIGKAKGVEVLSDFRLAPGPILDVRSPIEFEKGHIPGALKFSLFTDDERAKIGTFYKTKGKEAAVELGFDLVGPRLGEMVRQANEFAPGKSVRIICARGGLRSKSVAWLLETAGFEVLTLTGGYKSYRLWVRETVSIARRIKLLSGLTGTGKTDILRALRNKGEQVLDLEQLANHRGSSFGGLGMPAQPTTQYFENLIAKELSAFDRDREVWIEAESGRIGRCWVPEELFGQMKSASVIEITRPMGERLGILTEMYGESNVTELIEATKRITKHLGGERTRTAVDLISKNQIRKACRVILEYYDRSYGVSRERRLATPFELNVGGMSAADAAAHLIRNTPA